MEEIHHAEARTWKSYVSQGLMRLGVGLVLIVAFGIVMYHVGEKLLADSSYNPASSDGASGYKPQTYQTADGSDCNIAVVPLAGELFTNAADAAVGGGVAADDVLAALEQANGDDSIKGIVLAIDSPGGSPAGGEMIANALKASNKPTVALIREMGDSAAYFAATGADVIIASPMSDVGDIGVTSSFLDYSKQDTTNGQQFVQISSGKYKDAGNPDKALTVEEQRLLQRNVDELYKTLTNEIAQNRNMSTTTVVALADGSSMPGSLAIGKGLIDMLGDATTASDWFEKKFGNGTTATLCQ
jgi:protease-4